MTKHICAYPGCTKEGTFPAPKNPRDISARQYFCQEHIKEFNKSWNGLEGFSTAEINNLHDGAATWNRPTWTIGSNAQSKRASHFRFDSADDLFRFFNQRRAEDQSNKAQNTSSSELPPDVLEASSILGIDAPFSKPQLKKRYLELVKKNHPDLNPDSNNAEEAIKRINVAYQIIKDFIS